MRYLGAAFRPAIFILLCAGGAAAQCLPPEIAPAARAQQEPVQIPLVVPAGTPLRVALSQRVRVDKVGEPVQATLTHPIYAFDLEVIPAGTELVGKITRIDPVAKKRRTLGILNGDFTPARTYGVEFDALLLPNGLRVAIDTQVSPGVADVVRLVSDPQREKKRNAAAKAAADAKKQVEDSVRGAIHTVRAPGRWERLKRYLAAQLPFRRQFLERGMRFSAVLEGPLDFGEVTRTSEELAELGTAPAEDSLLEARLVSAVSSADAQPGTPVEAFVTAPLFSPEHKLVFPAGSRLLGEVAHAKPARKMRRHGQLRVVFQRIELPDGVVRSVQASLSSVEVDRAAGLKLDAEGGAEGTDSKKRYLATGFTIAAAVLASQREVEPGEAPETNPGGQAAAGGTGFRLVGAITSFAIGSPVFSTVLGAYGAGLSIHRNFLSRGRDVNLPKHTPLEILFGRPRPQEKSGQ